MAKLAKSPTADSASLEELGTCVNAPSTQNRSTRGREGARGYSWIFKSQIGFATSLIAIFITVHIALPPARLYTRPFYELSYYDPLSTKYRQGMNDFPFVVGWIIVLTALRAIAIDCFFIPIAHQSGLKKKASIRFAEQGWLLLYHSTFWSLGMYIFYTSNYWLNMWNLWVEWPTRDMAGIFKWYTLVQSASWLQQIITVNVEERRKDYHQMFTHHVITCTLIFISYVYRFTNVANVILCTMDVVDLLLPAAKMLKYLHFETACNYAFGLFVLTWFIARHVFYLIVCYAIHRDVPGAMLYGCYDGATSQMRSNISDTPDAFGHLAGPFVDLNGVICLNKRIKWIFLSMLLSLQVLSIVWFTMIVRVVAKVVNGGAPSDTRSEDEEDEEDVEDVKKGPAGRSIEGETIEGVVPSSTFKKSVPTRTSGRFSRGGARVRLVEPSNREALLGRIGCDKTA